MHQNEGFFIGSRAVMERKISQKKRFFGQNAITTYTSSTEKDAQNNMTWTGQSIKKSTTWLKGIRANNPVKRLFTWKASSIAPARSGRGSSRGYAEVFEDLNVSRDDLIPR
ncbi:hypothetical protein CJF30_00010256 [Rutstroemia sp. NJR-2017a BBW]|nr:hypothetical protein CJF30_00010256 [Rutstroemia sp. NJR-2017a BBW]